jgi:uncharacterized membrane protein YcaP (DUF421 family)
MQAPDRGLLQGIVILICVVILHRGLSLLTFKSRKLEVLTQGDVSLLVKNGVIDVEELKKSAMSHEQLFAQIRGKDIRHLGQVKRVYLEACGLFSVYENSNPKPGLSVLPAKDDNICRSQSRTDKYVACKNCGYTIELRAKHAGTCRSCGISDWDQAVIVVQRTHTDKAEQRYAEQESNDIL